MESEKETGKDNRPKPPVPKKTEASQTGKIKRIAKRTTDNLSTPSIKEALQGNFKEKQLTAKEQHQLYSNTEQEEEFSTEDLKQTWEAFLTRLDDRPNLQSTLSYVPELEEDFQLRLEIENTVQEDLINSIKTELVSWLRKELKNSKIQLNTVITQKTKGRIIYTDAEKFDELAKKNASIILLKQKFNLDFGQ